MAWGWLDVHHLGQLAWFAVVIHRFWMLAGIKLPAIIGWFLTFNFVNVAWIIFRAEDVESALRIASQMFKFDFQPLSGTYLYKVMSTADSPIFAAISTPMGGMIAVIFPIAIVVTALLKNTYELSGYKLSMVQINHLKVALAATAASAAIIKILSGTPSAFLYFNF